MLSIEQQQVSALIVGNFNPAIFNPDWLKDREIITPDEASTVEMGVIHKEFFQFKVSNLQFEGTTEQFTVKTTAEPFIRVADIIMGIFGDALPHTPMKAMGINYYCHFKVTNVAIQTKLGRALAPLSPWGAWGRLLDPQCGDVDKIGGLASLTMMQKAPSDRRSGRISATVQPSNVIEPAGTGVFFGVNDHYDQTEDETETLPARCSNLFTPSLARAKRILTDLHHTIERL